MTFLALPARKDKGLSFFTRFYQHSHQQRLTILCVMVLPMCSLHSAILQWYCTQNPIATQGCIQLRMVLHLPITSHDPIFASQSAPTAKSFPISEIIQIALISLSRFHFARWWYQNWPSQVFQMDFVMQFQIQVVCANTDAEILTVSDI